VWSRSSSAAADRIYHGRVNDLLEFLDDEIKRRGQHNRSLANAYAAGEIDSCINKRQWTDTLQKTRTRLRNCLKVLKVQNPILLLDIEREIALDIPTWAGDLYKRSEYAQQELTAERRMAYAARKRRPLDEDFFAARQAKVYARIAAEKAARQEAARQQEALLATLTEHIDAATGPEALLVAKQMMAGVTPQQIVNEMHHHIQPSSPVAPDYVEVDNDEEFRQEVTA
jgi:hypothetical protein